MLETKGCDCNQLMSMQWQLVCISDVDLTIWSHLSRINQLPHSTDESGEIVQESFNLVHVPLVQLVSFTLLRRGKKTAMKQQSHSAFVSAATLHTAFSLGLALCSQLANVISSVTLASHPSQICGVSCRKEQLSSPRPVVCHGAH